MANRQPGFFSDAALAVFKNFSKIANSPGGVVGNVGAHDAALPMPENEEEPNGRAAKMKLLSSFCSKLPTADRKNFLNALDQLGELLGPHDNRENDRFDEDGYDDQTGEGENPYAAKPDDELDGAQDFENPSGSNRNLGGRYAQSESQRMPGGPEPFGSMPRRGGKISGAQDSIPTSYRRMFPQASGIGLDPTPTVLSSRQREERMAFDSAIASGTADYERWFPQTKRIGLL